MIVLVEGVWDGKEYLAVEGLNGRRFVYAARTRQGHKSGEGVDVVEMAYFRCS